MDDPMPSTGWWVAWLHHRGTRFAVWSSRRGRLSLTVSCDLVSVRTGCPWPSVARREDAWWHVSSLSRVTQNHILNIQYLYPAHKLSTFENGHKNHVQLLTSDVNSPASSSTNSPIRSLEIPADSKPMALWYSVAFGSQCHLS